MQNKKELLIEMSMFLLIIVYIALIKTIDIAQIGPQNSEVGFATINGFFHNLFDYNETWYNITKYLGLIPFIGIFCYAILGLTQLIKRKSIFKVDKKLIILGIFYIVVGLVYIFFEKVVINYRPVILENELEASFPSSHTLLAITSSLSIIIMNKYYIKNKKLLKVINISLLVLMTVLIIGRILSGVHWITDIIGGILISIFLVYTFYNIITKIK